MVIAADRTVFADILVNIHSLTFIAFTLLLCYFHTHSSAPFVRPAQDVFCDR